MNTPRSERIGAAFAAAGDYDRNARIQARAACQLAARIAALPLPAGPRVLEIGCGTGFLTEQMASAGIGGSWLVTDLAPVMLARARARMGDAPHRRFAVLDGERGPVPADAPFDLVAASLAFQWFSDLPAALRRLSGWLAPGGWLAFTTLADGTFTEWREANLAAGALPGTPPFPDDARLAGMLPGAAVTIEDIPEQHESARAFLRAVKAIGAGTPAEGHRPLGAGSLRKAMRHFEAGGGSATYRLAIVLWHKPAA